MFKVLIPHLTSWQGLHMALRCIFVGIYLHTRKRPLGGLVCSRSRLETESSGARRESPSLTPGAALSQVQKGARQKGWGCLHRRCKQRRKLLSFYYTVKKKKF